MPKAEDDHSTCTPLTAADLDTAINGEPRILDLRLLELLVEINRVMADLWDATGEADLRKPIGDMLSAKADQWRAGKSTFTSH